jgi:hypothetical protein
MSFRTKTFELDDIQAHPKDYGLPTFAEFRRSPEKYRKRDDHDLALVDKGSQILGKYVQKHWYVFRGYRTQSPEKFEEIVKNEGFSLADLVPVPQVKPDIGLKCDMEILFVTKAQFKVMEREAELERARKIIIPA